MKYYKLLLNPLQKNKLLILNISFVQSPINFTLYLQINQLFFGDLREGIAASFCGGNETKDRAI
jgi:hypothetical protein